MPKAWNGKEERKYQHIKESSKKRGASTKRAKEIAARTVNKERRENGKTQKSRTTGTGNPRTSLEERSRDELLQRASQLNIRGRSKMKKAELVQEIRKSA